MSVEDILQIFYSVQSHPFEAFWLVYVLGGWLVLCLFLLKGMLFLWAFYKAKRYTSGWKWIHLALDVPALNVQTPKAVEQLFAHIYSVMEPPSIQTMYRRGFVQFYYSFEIISIEGYIQFIIRTLDIYRDVVEAAVYAQYPEAEITEVEDYVNTVPTVYPNDTHNCWAADFVLTEHYAFPIRVYSDFEHSIAEDTVLKDPMGTFLESFSRIGPGEQMWYQMIVEPLEEKGWKKEVMEKIDKLIGASKKSKPKIIDKALDTPGKLMEFIGTYFLFIEPGEGEKKRESDQPNQILYLTPGQKNILEAMEKKISKIGFKTKIRALYVARKEVYNPARGVNSLVGAINQFNIPMANSLLPKYLTSTRYLFAERRKNYRRSLLMKAYKGRDMYAGKSPYVFNLEELATLWHFPMSFVKTPLVQKAQIKRSEPPPDLPLEGILGVTAVPSLESIQTDDKKTSQEPRYPTDTSGGGFSPGQKFG